MSAQNTWLQAFLVESAVAGIIAQQAHNGVNINKVKIGFYTHVLSERINALDRIAVPQLPKELEKGCTASEPFLKSGGYKANVSKWLAVEGLEDLPIEGPFCGISWRPFSMGRTEAIKEYLAGLGWKPDTWKFKDLTMHSTIKRPLDKKEQELALEKYMSDLKTSNFGPLRMQILGIKPGTMTKRQVKELLLKKRKVPTGAKLTEESLENFEGGEIGTVLKQRLTLAHRRSLLVGIAKLIRDDGRIEAQAITIGTPTMRMRHKGVVNIPKAAKHVIFGGHCRSIFEAGYCTFEDNPRGFVFIHHKGRVVPGTNILWPEDQTEKKALSKGVVARVWVPAGRRVMVGYDGAGLELRMLAHFINDLEYIKQILDGDIHSYNQILAGLPNRDAAKTFIYAFLYGAGDQKIGDIIGGTREDGKRIKERFFESLPLLKELIDRVKEDAEKGYVIGLDGRKLRLRKDGRGRPMTHKALNLLLQGAGAVVMKYAMVLLDEAIEEEGLDALKVIDMHDEGQYDVHPKHVVRVRELMDICVMKAGELLGMNLPLASDSIVGLSWKDTH